MKMNNLEKKLYPSMSYTNLLTHRPSTSNSFQKAQNNVTLPVQPPKRHVMVTIITIDKQRFRMTFQESLNIQAVKRHLFNNYTKSLEIDQMSLTYNGKVLSSSLSVILEQVKASLDRIRNLSYIDKEDPISCEKGMVKLPCGCETGRATLQEFMQKSLKQGQFIIQCPYSSSSSRTKCKDQIDFNLLVKILACTQKESFAISEALSMNLYKANNSQKCPKCKHPIIKLNLSSNRVACQKCGYGDFCYACLKKWVGDNVCTSQDCLFIGQRLLNSKQTKPFQLTVLNSVQRVFDLPKFRACPSCSMIIEHTQGCKHMACPNCKTSFCWVCLGLKNGTNWACRGAFSYCGRIAPIQSILPK